MAVTYQSAGTVSYNTPIFPGYPASIATGDLLILAVGAKSGTASVTTPVGWLALGNLAGTTGTTGADVGPTRIFLYAKVYDGVETLGSSLQVVGSWNNPWAQIYRFSNATGFWDISFASGEDTAGGTTWSATMSSTMDITSGDVMLAASVDPTDVSHTYSAAAVSATGATFGSSSILVQPRSSNGQDIGGFVFTQPVSSGSSSSAPVVSASISGTTTNVYGPTALIRIREVTEGGQPTNTASLAAVELDVANATDGQARLAGVVTEVGASPDSQALLAGVVVEVMTPREKTIYLSSLDSSTAFGLPTISLDSGAEDQDVALNGLDSAAGFGSPSFEASATVEVTSLDSASGFGQPAVTTSVEIDPDSLGSAGSFGQPAITPSSSIDLNSLDSPATFGQPDVSTASSIDLNSLSPAGVFGQPAFSQASEIAPNSLDSTAAFGQPEVSAAATAALDSLDSGATFGIPTVTAANAILVDSLDSSSTFGSPSVAAAAAISLDSLDSGGAFGLPTISLAGTQAISVDSLTSAAVFGTPELTAQVAVAMESLVGGSVVGLPDLATSASVLLEGLASAGAFGQPSFLIELVVSPNSLVGDSSIGTPVFLLATGVTPDEVMRLELDALAVDGNSCTVVSVRRVTDLGKVTIEEDALSVSRS